MVEIKIRFFGIAYLKCLKLKVFSNLIAHVVSNAEKKVKHMGESNYLLIQCASKAVGDSCSRTVLQDSWTMYEIC